MGSLNDRSPRGFLDVCRYDILWEVEPSRTTVVMGCRRVRIVSRPYSGTIRIRRHFDDEARNIRRVSQDAASRICTSSTSAIANGAFKLLMRGLFESLSSDSSLVPSGFSPLFRSTPYRSQWDCATPPWLDVEPLCCHRVTASRSCSTRCHGTETWCLCAAIRRAGLVVRHGTVEFPEECARSIKKERKSRLDGVERGKGTTRRGGMPRR